MAKIDIQTRRQNGVYYTPIDLSIRLVKPFVVDLNPSSILDPACGDGSLLFAAKKALREIGNGNKKCKIDIFGCDISPDFEKLKTLKPKEIWQDDFLELQLNKKFDLILMNPPYIRHQRIPNKLKQVYNDRVQGSCPLSKVSDLWAYFLVKSVELVNDGGNLAAILPWSFLQADFACKLRRWLADRFSIIEVLAITSPQFEHANERIALVWLKNKGRSAQNINIRNVEHPTQNVAPINLSWSEWLRPRIIATNFGSVFDIISSLSSKGFVRFRDMAQIKIGTVTGADAFFIAKKQFAQSLGLKDKDCHQIIKTLKNLRGFQLNGNCLDQVLMYLPEKLNSPKLVEYVERGQQEGLHLRAHSIRRNLWYALPRSAPPDAFFPYRSSHTPYILINKSGNLCTNSIHAIYWNHITKRQIEWVQVSLLSIFGQLSLEAYAKTYGSGVLKIEPSTLGNAIITTGLGQFPKNVYNKINILLKKNEKVSASMLATDIIKKYYDIDSKTLDLCKAILNELRQRRQIPLLSEMK